METTQTTTAATPKLGRPVNKNSNRQKILAERELRKQNGEFKLGRPIKEGSKRQLELAAKAEKIANGYVPKKGRPVVPGSKRQLTLAKKAMNLQENVAVDNDTEMEESED